MNYQKKQESVCWAKHLFTEKNASFERFVPRDYFYAGAEKPKLFR